MKLTKETNILIIGLGVMGGSYAKALTEKGYKVSCITKEKSDVKYGLEHSMISYGTTEVEPELVAKAELIVFALYPQAFADWVAKYQHLFSPGTLITDVTGVKGSIVYKVQDMLRSDVEYIAAHPMAGRERSGVEYADPEVFRGANYIVTPTEKNTIEAIRICKELGEELGFSRISELSPEEKYGALGKIIEGSKSTLYVGDGINDAPSLARADVGIAMGALGADSAIESADVVIMSDELERIPEAVRISRKTLRIAKQNIAFALSVKLAVMILGAFNMANMWLAVFADVGVSVIAILNAMRTLRYKRGAK